MRRYGGIAVIELRRRAQGPERIEQVRPRKRDQIGAAGGEDRIGVVGLGDRPDRHGREPPLVADAVAERRLEHPAVDRLRARPGLPRRDVDQVGPGRGERLADLHRLGGRDAFVARPIIGGDADRHRPVAWPGGAHRREHLERKAQAVLQAAAIFVGAGVLQRRDEPGEQVAVRGVELDHVEAGVEVHAHGGDELVAHQVHVGARHGSRNLVDGRPRDVARRDDRPVARVERDVIAFPADPG